MTFASICHECGQQLTSRAAQDSNAARYAALAAIRAGNATINQMRLAVSLPPIPAATLAGDVKRVS
jgi:hypothetical protein